MALRAVGNKIIVAAVTVTDDDILIPESAKHKNYEKASVLSVGPGRRFIDGSLDVPVVSVGDNVLYNPFGAVKVKIDGKEFLILSPEDILALEIK